VDIDTIKLAQLYGTTHDDIRAANLTRTVAFCRTSSGNWKRALIMSIERDRPLNTVWHDCSDANRYTYIPPGETVLIERNKSALSFGEKQTLLGELLKCPDQGCVDKITLKLNPRLGKQGAIGATRMPPTDPPATNVAAPQPSVSPVQPAGAGVNHPEKTQGFLPAFARSEAFVIGIYGICFLLLGTCLMLYQKNRALHDRLTKDGRSGEQIAGDEAELRETIRTGEQTISELRKGAPPGAATLRELVAFFSNEEVTDNRLVVSLNVLIRGHLQTLTGHASGLMRLVCGEKAPANQGNLGGMRMLKDAADRLEALIADLRKAIGQNPIKQDTLASAVSAVAIHIQTKKSGEDSDSGIRLSSLARLFDPSQRDGGAVGDRRARRSPFITTYNGVAPADGSLDVEGALRSAQSFVSFARTCTRLPLRSIEQVRQVLHLHWWFSQSQTYELRTTDPNHGITFTPNVEVTDPATWALLLERGLLAPEGVQPLIHQA